MKITEERLGFLNMRLVQRMNEVGVSATQLAHSVSLTYEQVRKLVMGRCLPSDSTLERLCASLDLNNWGINPKAAPLYISFPLLIKEEQEIFRLQIIAFVEAKKKREKQRTECAA
jgi:DNA-binding Xre family transcriptional regulator